MFNEIFERIHLSLLAESLLYGNIDTHRDDAASYEQRQKEAENELAKRLDLLSPGKSEDVQEAVFDYLANVNPIIFEFGMKAGVKLYRDLVGGMPGDIKLKIT